MNVTIVIPVYNRAEYLLRTLQSIPDGYPLIIIDNGSTDGSLQIAEDYRERRIMHPGAASVVLDVEPMPGASAARNRGLALCTTEWVYFFDSDDLFTGLPAIPVPSEPSAPLLDMICFPVRMIAGSAERVRDYRPTAAPSVHILSSMLNTVSMLFRTEWLRNIGGWDSRCRIWDDWELGVRALLQRPRLQWITDTVYHRIYVHDDSITGPSYSARWEYIVETLTIVYDRIKAIADNPEGRYALCALDLRSYIISGMLRREGSPQAAAIVRSLIVHPRPLGRFLEWYVAHGGRGAWRIALAGCTSKYT